MLEHSTYFFNMTDWANESCPLTFYSILLLITAIGYCPQVILIGELGYIMPIRISYLEMPVL